VVFNIDTAAKTLYLHRTESLSTAVDPTKFLTVSEAAYLRATFSQASIMTTTNIVISTP